MIGLDANILVRYLTQDDRVQSDRAATIIDDELTEEEPGFVSAVSLVETVWVLDRSYGFPAQQIAAAILRILQIESLVFEQEQGVFTAITALREGWGSFSDALIAEIGIRIGCAHTLTFDQKALHLPGFQPA